MSFWSNVETLTLLARCAPYVFIVGGFFIAVSGQYAQSLLTDRVDALKRQIELSKKKTPPNFEASLRPGPDGTLKVAIKAISQVPAQATWLVVTKKDVIVSGIMMQPETLFPTTDKAAWLYSAPIQTNKVVDGHVELRFDFVSIHSAEFGHPTDLKGRIVQRYLLKDDQLQPIP